MCSCQLFFQLREPSVKALAEQIFKADNVAYVARNINLGCIGELVAERNASADGKAVVDFLKRKLKSELEQKLHKQQRKHKEIDTKPLSEPLKRWSELSVHEKHEIALTMIEVVTISDETGIDIKFSI